MGLLERHSMPLFNVPYRITVSFDNEQFTYQILDSTEVQAQNEEDAIRGAIEQQELIQEYREDKGKGFL